MHKLSVLVKCQNLCPCLSQDCRGTLKSGKLSDDLPWCGRGTWICWTLLVSTDSVEGTWVIFGQYLSLQMSWRVAWSPLFLWLLHTAAMAEKACRKLVVVVFTHGCVTGLSLGLWYMTVSGGDLWTL